MNISLRALFFLAFLLLSAPLACSAGPDEDLLDAVIGNNDLKAQELVVSGANVNTRQPDGWTPLLFSVYNHNFPLSVFLIERGADVNAQDYHSGNSVLMTAVVSGETEFVKYLIERGVDVNARHRTGNTALSYALSNHSNDIVQLLRKAGAE